jgi:hypothetical protein
MAILARVNPVDTFTHDTYLLLAHSCNYDFLPTELRKS